MGLMTGLMAGCASPTDPENTEPAASLDGPGTMVFTLSDSVEVRIPGERGPGSTVLFNATERLELRYDDAGCLMVPVFEGHICLDEQGTGQWTDVLRMGDEPYQVAARWIPGGQGTTREIPPVDSMVWRLEFGKEDPWYGDLLARTYPGGVLQGTIETATGDFRFLHGKQDGNQLMLQTFDGAHLFHFSATVMESKDLVQGLFSSGNHYSTPFSGHPKGPEDPALSDGMTASWTGEEVAYSGKTLLADAVDWTWDPQDGRTHVLSIMGSWCPNCLDEHRMLKEILRVHPEVVVHTLAFERGLDQEHGEKQALNRLKHYHEEMELWRFEDRWNVILAGPASKTEARNALPFLDRVVSFPTTIVLHPDADAPWIHSGFNGPATGFKHDLERAAFEQAISGPSESR